MEKALLIRGLRGRKGRRGQLSRCCNHGGPQMAKHGPSDYMLDGWAMSSLPPCSGKLAVRPPTCPGAPPLIGLWKATWWAGCPETAPEARARISDWPCLLFFLGGKRTLVSAYQTALGLKAQECSLGQMCRFTGHPLIKQFPSLHP